MTKRLKEPVLDVYHHKLSMVTISSGFRKECPFCPKGMFLVGKDRETGQLLEYDICISCGQRVRYLDIDTLRRREPMNTSDYQS